MPRLPAACLLALLGLTTACSRDIIDDYPIPIDGQLAKQVVGTRGRPFGFGISSTGHALALQLDGVTAGRFEVHRDSIAGFVTLGYNPIDVTFTRGGSRAYVTLLGGRTVYEVDMRTGAVIDSTTFGGRQHRILISPDDRRYWVTGFDGEVWAVNRQSGKVIDSVALGGGAVRGIARNKRTGRLVLSRDYGTITLLDATTLDVREEQSLNGFVQEVVISADGDRLFVALEDTRCVMVLDASTLAVRDTITFGADPIEPFGMRLSDDGRTLLVSSPQTGRIAVVDVPTLGVRRVLMSGGVPRRIAFSPGGTLAFVTNEGGWIDVIQ